MNSKSELTERAHHTVADLAAELSAADGLPSGKERAVESAGDFVPGTDVLGAGDDLDRLIASAVDAADPQMVGVRVSVHLEDFTYYNILDLISLTGPAFDFAAGHGERVAELLDGDAFQIRIFFYPGNRSVHSFISSL